MIYKWKVYITSFTSSTIWIIIFQQKNNLEKFEFQKLFFNLLWFTNLQLQKWNVLYNSICSKVNPAAWILLLIELIWKNRFKITSLAKLLFLRLEKVLEITSFLTSIWLISEMQRNLFFCFGEKQGAFDSLRNVRKSLANIFSFE